MTNAIDINTLPVQEQRKYLAAKAALDLLPKNSVLGVGTGSTVNYLIDMLPSLNLEGAVASSKATEDKLKALGIEVIELNNVGNIDVYVDGADEIDHNLLMIKGGGAALTREKIVASVAKKFVCIVDGSKCVAQLGKAFPLPVEVIPMARSAVARSLVKLGGDPVWRQGVVTDNGNVILDVYNLNISNASDMETAINNIAGVVCNGLFAHRAANTAVIASEEGISIKQATESIFG